MRWKSIQQIRNERAEDRKITDSAKASVLANWHEWFAWYPVTQGYGPTAQTIWLERVCRRVTSFGDHHNRDKPLGWRIEWRVEYAELILLLKKDHSSVNSFEDTPDPVIADRHQKLKKLMLEKFQQKYKAARV